MGSPQTGATISSDKQFETRFRLPRAVFESTTYPARWLWSSWSSRSRLECQGLYVQRPALTLENEGKFHCSALPLPWECSHVAVPPTPGMSTAAFRVKRQMKTWNHSARCCTFSGAQYADCDARARSFVKTSLALIALFFFPFFYCTGLILWTFL